MKTMLIILAMTLNSTTGAASQELPCCEQPGHHLNCASIEDFYPGFEASLLEQGQVEPLDASSIHLFRAADEADLGFDTAPYLPAGFDPYAGKIAAWVDLGLNEADEQEDIDLGFDTTPYLPAGFDPYAGKIAAWVDLGLNEADRQEDMDLGFDTTPYLPAGFDPYQGMHRASAKARTEVIQAVLFQPEWMVPSGEVLENRHPGQSDGLEALGLIEIDEEETDLGFDTAPYLPAGFDPYQGMTTSQPLLK